MTHQERAGALLEWFAARPSIEEAIRIAALGLDNRGKRHSHQTRLKREALEVAKTRLLALAGAIAACRTFDELLTLIEKVTQEIHGLGELYCYDTALRIGAKLGLFPEKVYLHAGTRTGAKALALDHKARALDMQVLPEGLHELLPYEVEDVLCIYKEKLRSL